MNHTTRIEALSDGIFAIAMTLLVLDLRVPAADLHGDELAKSLCALTPRLLAYVMSFVLISQFWLALHAMFHNLARVDRSFLWWNLFFLLTISAVPFSTSLLGTHPFDVLAIRVYACHMILCGAMMLRLYRSAFNGDRLAIRPLTSEARRAATGRILFGPAGYIIAIALSFASIPLSLCVIGLVAVIYLLPTKIDRHYAVHPSNPDPKP
jgi:uncharacterized membrane protein